MAAGRLHCAARHALQLLLCSMLLTVTGCATGGLQSARQLYFQGRVEQAEQMLAEEEVSDENRVLFLMERGMIRQAAGAYEASSEDFITAADLVSELETYSVSRGAGSLVVNDYVQRYRGAPFERTMLHVFTAKNHLAQGHWDNAGVEARRIITSLSEEKRGPYPEDAFSRYMAGFCLELLDDPSNAALQYRKADALAEDVVIDPDTGHVAESENDLTRVADGQAELVCFVLLGRSPRAVDLSRSPARPYMPREPHATFSHNGEHLGRSYTLANTYELALTTEQMAVAREVAKTVTRVVLKEAVAAGVASATDSEWAGDLVRLLLIGLLEQPDLRRWETLPRWLQVARIPCPADAESFEVEIGHGAHAVRQTVRPLSRRGRILFAVCSDLPAPRPSTLTDNTH